MIATETRDDIGTLGRPDGGASLVILYDGTCSICTRTAQYVALRDRHGVVECADLQEEENAGRFPEFTPQAVRALMHAVDDRGRVTIGIDAVRELGSRLPRWRWIAWTLGVPGVRWVASIFYGLFARNRHWFNRFFGKPACEDGACEVDWSALDER